MQTMKNLMPEWFQSFNSDLSMIMFCRPELSDKIIIEKALEVSRKSILTVAQILNFAALEAKNGNPLPWEDSYEQERTLR